MELSYLINKNKNKTKTKLQVMRQIPGLEPLWVFELKRWKRKGKIPQASQVITSREHHTGFCFHGIDVEEKLFPPCRASEPYMSKK